LFIELPDLCLALPFSPFEIGTFFFVFRLQFFLFNPERFQVLSNTPRVFTNAGEIAFQHCHCPSHITFFGSNTLFLRLSSLQLIRLSRECLTQRLYLDDM
jgi:hypothetical protein